MNKYILLLIFFFFTISARANIIITDWKQNTTFTSFGKEVEVIAKARVDLPSDSYFYKEWSYIFDPRMKVEIVSAFVKGKSYKTSFGNNTLVFAFDKAFSGTLLEFHFKYKDYTTITKNYSRSDYVTIPPFAKNANGYIEAVVPNEYEVYSLNPTFLNQDNKYIWQGKVPEKGINELFSMTNKRAKWKVSLKSFVKGQKDIEDVEVLIPNYFINGGQTVESLNIKTSPNYTKIEDDKENDLKKIMVKDLNAKQLDVEVLVNIDNNYSTYRYINLNPTDFFNISNEDTATLSTIVNKVRMDNNPNNLPLYVRLAEFVHSYIQYDEKYKGKDMTIEEILDKKKGVCVHYSILYENLLKAAGIPATSVSGFSFNEDKNKFEEHAWTLVSLNGNWIPIDPTWGIYSGKLPISHIFLYKDIGSSIQYTVYRKGSMNDIITGNSFNIDYMGTN